MFHSPSICFVVSKFIACIVGHAQVVRGTDPYLLSALCRERPAASLRDGQELAPCILIHSVNNFYFPPPRMEVPSRQHELWGCSSCSHAVVWLWELLSSAPWAALVLDPLLAFPPRDPGSTKNPKQTIISHCLIASKVI